jgi:protein-tyrosine phosphatase
MILIGFTACGRDQEPPPAEKAAPSESRPERQVRLEGQPNFRDLGGYVTSEGRSVKWGQVYRSGEMPRLIDKDVERLEGLGIRTVVNFLTPEETEARGPDRLPPGVREVSLPISGGGLTSEVSEARRTGDFSKIPTDLNPEFHRLLTGLAREEYTQLLREAADPANRPLVFHCSHGIHRTGTAAAILLSALGVPWETVREDYLLSNDYREEEVRHRLSQLREKAAETLGVPPDQVDTTNMEAFYILESSYIDAALDEMIKEYGSVEGYIRNGLGLSDDEIQRLRTELLE